MDQPNQGDVPQPPFPPKPPVTIKPPQFDPSQIYPESRPVSASFAEELLKTDQAGSKRHHLIGVPLIAAYMILFSIYFAWLYYNVTHTLPIIIVIIYGLQIALGLGLLAKSDLARKVTVILAAINLVLGASGLLGATAISSGVRSSQIVGLAIGLVIMIYLSLPSVKSYFY